MHTYFEVYEKLAGTCTDGTLVNGRYEQQKYQESFIIMDVVEKLDLKPDDTLLDIGCGNGFLSLGLSNICKNVYGIDNETIVTKLMSSYVPSNVKFRGGNWLDLDVDDIEGINKIVIYSVVQYLRNIDDLFRFVDKALKLLGENGEVLVGDIPNIDKKKRFISTRLGSAFDKQFREEQNQNGSMIRDEGKKMWKKMQSEGLEDTIIFNDAIIERIMSRYHDLSCDVYVLPQKPYLPFGHTREDILIVKR